MKHRMCDMLIVMLLAGTLLSCDASKMVLVDVPQSDARTPMYYVDDGWKVRHAGDSTGTDLYSGSVDFTLLPIGTTAPFESSISPFGRYLATIHNKVRLAELHLSARDIGFGIYDLVKREFVLDIATRVRMPEYRDDAWQVAWSERDSGFFYPKDDTLRKCYPDGTEYNLVWQEDLQSFSVAPSESKIILVRADSVILYDAVHRTRQPVTTDVSAGKNVRAFSWTADETAVAFVNGWTIYLVTIRSMDVRTYKADGKVLWTQWLPDGSIVYTEAHFPSDMQMIKTTESFRICRYVPTTGEMSVLHERVNQSPLLVRPRLSPSGSLLLFSEQKLNGGNEVKLMSLDGQRMKTLCDGVDPCWGR